MEKSSSKLFILLAPRHGKHCIFVRGVLPLAALQWHGLDSKRSRLISISRLGWQNMTEQSFRHCVRI